MKRFLNTAALAMALAFVPASAASASTVLASSKASALGAASNPIAQSTATVDLSFDVSGIFSVDGLGDPDNEVFTLSIGPMSRVTGIGWDVTIFADSPSYLSEMVVNFGTSSSGFVNLTVGIGDDNPGTASYSSGGIVDLVGLGFDFTVDADGLLRLEFFESFDDFTNDWDGIWRSGTLSIQYAAIPEPATWAMMISGFGLVGIAARRRRSLIAQA